MASKTGLCRNCQRPDMFLPADGLCGSCYAAVKGKKKGAVEYEAALTEAKEKISSWPVARMKSKGLDSREKNKKAEGAAKKGKAEVTQDEKKQLVKISKATEEKEKSEEQDSGEMLEEVGTVQVIPITLRFNIEIQPEQKDALKSAILRTQAELLKVVEKIDYLEKKIDGMGYAENSQSAV